MFARQCVREKAFGVLLAERIAVPHGRKGLSWQLVTPWRQLSASMASLNYRFVVSREKAAQQPFRSARLAIRTRICACTRCEDTLWRRHAVAVWSRLLRHRGTRQVRQMPSDAAAASVALCEFSNRCVAAASASFGERGASSRSRKSPRNDSFSRASCAAHRIAFEQSRGCSVPFRSTSLLCSESEWTLSFAPTNVGNLNGWRSVRAVTAQGDGFRQPPIG